MKFRKDEFWLIDPSFVSVLCFHKKNEHRSKFNEFIYVDEGIITGIYGEEPPLMKNRKEMKIEEARSYWRKLKNEGWQDTSPKW